MKKSIIFSIVLLVFVLLLPQTISSEDISPDQKALEKKIEEYQRKLNELNQQKNTLSSQIQYMDTQIYLTTLKMQETEQKIENTQKEIEVLSTKIEGLDSSLSYLSKLLLERIIEGYKKRSVSIFTLLLDNNNAYGFLNQIKYLKRAEENNQKLLIQVQGTKLNFEEQKKLRETKKAELNNLNNMLNTQKISLNNQKIAKQTLLEITKNDELTYQSLLEEAKRQIAGFKQFVQSTGADIIPPDGLGTGEGGWYYSQRDSRWANNRMGNSNETVLDVGCFITSIAMVMKFNGADFNPLNLANDPKYFFSNTAYMSRPDNFNGSWPKGLSYRNISYSEITDYLNRNVPVIAGVKGEGHYVVLKKVVDGEFIMNDPIYGPDKKVSDYYSLSGPYGIFQ